MDLQEGFKIWSVVNEKGEPTVYMIGKDGVMYEISSEWNESSLVQQTVGRYILVSTGEIFLEQWLKEHPKYIHEYLKNETIMLVIDDTEPDFQRISELMKELNFDNAWDFRVVDGEIKIFTERLRKFGNEMLGYLTVNEKNPPWVHIAEDHHYNTGTFVEHHQPIKLSYDWFLFGDNRYGQLGIGHGTKFYIKPNSGGQLHMPEFEMIYDDEKVRSFPRTKHPSQVVTNPREGDIYPLFPADWNNSGIMTTDAMVFEPTTHTLPSTENPNYSYTFNSNAIGWHYIMKYDGSVWKQSTFMQNVEKYDVNGNQIDPKVGEVWFIRPQDNDYPFDIYEIDDIQQGKNFTVFLLNDGSVWTCGSNFRGQLGSGIHPDETYKKDINPLALAREWKVKGNPKDLPYVTVPRKIDLEGFSAIQVCEQTWIAIGGNRILYGCGANTFGQLGQGNRLDYFSLVPIADNVIAAELTAGTLVFDRVETTGTKLYGCGYNYDDRLNLGSGYGGIITTPVEIVRPIM